MSNEGWVCLHRRILDNPWLRDPDFFTVWVHMLLMATHKDHKSIWMGQEIILKPGQFTCGRKKMAAISGVQESKITRIWNVFKSEQQIEQLTSAKYSLFTVINWERYQKVNSPVNTKRTAPEQHLNTKQQGNNETIKINIQNFTKFWNNYPIRKGGSKGSKKTAERKFCNLSKKDQKAALDGLEKYAAYLDLPDNSDWHKNCEATKYLNQEYWTQDEIAGEGAEPIIQGATDQERASYEAEKMARGQA